VSDIRDARLAPAGRDRIEWAERSMGVLRLIRKRFEAERPLAGLRLSACLHVTAETANLARTLQAGGAELVVCASNPLSTQDEVAAAMAEIYGVPTFAIKDEDRETYYRHLHAAIDHRPQLTMDDGADLIGLLHSQRGDALPGVLGGTEETTTGVIRLRAMAADGALRFPVIAVNDAQTKHLFDNRHGTGQSTLDGVLRATNFLFAGSEVTVIGYGWCSRGIAERARGLGARVTVTEVDPLRALEAVMDGFAVAPALTAVRRADLVITSTGDIHVIDRAHFQAMKDGVIIANSGHFNVEINIPALEELSERNREVRPFVREYQLAGGRRINLLADGRLVNLGAAEGHPSAVMDMSFANQALAAERIVREHHSLKPGVYGVSREQDLQIAALKLRSLGIEIDSLTPEQVQYLGSWKAGT